MLATNLLWAGAVLALLAWNLRLAFRLSALADVMAALEEDLVNAGVLDARREGE